MNKKRDFFPLKNNVTLINCLSNVYRKIPWMDHNVVPVQ